MVGDRLRKTMALRRRLAAGASVVAIALGCAVSGGAFAQSNGLPADVSVPPGSKLLLSADQLIYNDRQHTVVAEGAVRIAYGGYRLVARRVEYNQDTGRMQATGEVELVNPDGTKLYADKLDVTDNFSDGFVNALRIDTTDRTHIVAESAERRGGVETQFNNGVYTACEPCKKHPEKAPFWQVKARRVIHDADQKTIRLRDARFEMFGMPVAYFPYFSMPDQTVKRKSGFLRPGFDYKETLGFGISVPYYQVISPSMDATFTGTGYTQQGFLAEAEFRQQFRNGFHRLTLAGIDQASPDAFEAGTADQGKTFRGLAASAGHFDINPRWSVGWNVMLESDQNFGRTYGITGYDESVVTSEAHLTGLSGRNYFDLHAYHFDEQPPDNYLRADAYKTLERKQPFVLPVIDYNYTPDIPVFGGQLTFTANETSLTRGELATDRNGNNVVSRSRPFRQRQPADRRPGVEADPDDAAGPAADADPRRARRRLRRQCRRSGQNLRAGDGQSRRQRVPRPVDGDGGAGGALPDPRRHGAQHPCHRADRAGLRPPGRASSPAGCPTRTRKASSSTPPTCSAATSFPASTAWRAARAPMWACATPARSTTA